MERSASAATARRTSSSSKGLVDAGKYRPVIDRSYELDEIVDATRYVESGQKTGNVTLRVSEVTPGEMAPDKPALPGYTLVGGRADADRIARLSHVMSERTGAFLCESVWARAGAASTSAAGMGR